jgi:iduronate 2-sulfatase
MNHFGISYETYRISFAECDIPTHREVMFAALIVVLFFLTARTTWAGEPDSRPNVLFIMVDDLRPELGCFGSLDVHSPRIDELAARGLVFDRAYCQQAHCMPSRFSLLSGRRPDTAGIWAKEDPRPALAGKPFLPAHFRNHGYYCVGLGKISHNSRYEEPSCWSEPHQMPPNYPFEYRTRAGQALVARMQDEAAAAGLPDPFEGVPANIRRGMPYESLDVADNALGDGQLADEAVAALERLAGRPFFLGVGFLRPHLPFVAPKRYWDLYDPKNLPEVDPTAAHDGLSGLSANDSRELRRQYRGVPAKGPLPEELSRNLWHGYLACVSYIDAQIGRILDALERLDLASNTIVVISGDHGFHLGEIGLWCKGTNFEAATRTPLIIHAPGMNASGRKTESIVELVGLYPTLCDLAGLPKPDHLEGDSFAALLSDPALEPIEAAFTQYPRGNSMGRAIRTPRYRLVDEARSPGGRQLRSAPE